jgi:hypothetical protein
MSVFFGKRDSNAVPYVTVARCEPGRSVNMQVVVSQPIGYKVHWAGRAILCPGEGCEMCRTNSARFCYSVVGFVGSERKFIELSDGTVSSMRTQLETNGLQDFCGSCWRFSKASRKSSIEATFIKSTKTSLLLNIMHLRVVSRMFGLCDAHEGETAAQFEADLMQAARQRILRIIADFDRLGVGSRSA